VLVAGACALLQGCAALVAALPSSAAIGAYASGAAVAAKAAVVAAPEIIPAGAALGAVALTGYDNPDRIVGMSRANLETCAGFTNRSSEVLADAKERWHYENRSCRVSVTLTSGYVSQVEFSRAPSGDCASVLQYCR
jgi:hypothetical protein